METIARHFDMPIESGEHALLAETAWMGGELVSVRYYLGRLLNRNLFRESDKGVERCLKAWLAQHTSEEGAALVDGVSTWQVPAAILQLEFERETNRVPSRKRREIAAVVAYLTKPTISLSELARQLGTTEKQLNRMSLLNLTRALFARSERGEVAAPHGTR